ncbi:hypothetical protein X975_13148, partial [Stegodyphus mimosarum]
MMKAFLFSHCRVPCLPLLAFLKLVSADNYKSIACRHRCNR